MKYCLTFTGIALFLSCSCGKEPEAYSRHEQTAFEILTDIIKDDYEDEGIAFLADSQFDPILFRRFQTRKTTNAFSFRTLDELSKPVCALTAEGSGVLSTRLIKTSIYPLTGTANIGTMTLERACGALSVLSAFSVSIVPKMLSMTLSRQSLKDRVTLLNSGIFHGERLLVMDYPGKGVMLRLDVRRRRIEEAQIIRDEKTIAYIQYMRR